MKICCYGDSNTWGYDPRSPFGDRYDAPWPEQLGRLLGAETENWGINGQCIPALSQEFSILRQAVCQAQPELLILMLGTNDVLMATAPRPESIARQMERLILFLKEQFPGLSIFLLAPPRIRIPGEQLQETITALPGLYERIAAQYHLGYLNLQDLSLSLAHDGVHLTEDAHGVLAHALFEFFKKALQADDFWG